MIETQEAYEGIDDLVAVPGLDSIVIGPADLSWALGARGDMEDPRVIKAFEQIIASAKKSGCAIGCGMGPDANYAYRVAQRGVQWLQVGMDCSILGQAYDQIHASFNQLWNEGRK